MSSADLGAIAAALGTAKGVESKPVYEDVVRGLGNRSRVKAFVRALREEGLTPHLAVDEYSNVYIFGHWEGASFEDAWRSRAESDTATR